MPLPRARLRPARPGLRVPDPGHGGMPLPAEGLEVELSSYWLRRLSDGDVLRVAGNEERDHPGRPSPEPRPSRKSDRNP